MASGQNSGGITMEELENRFAKLTVKVQQSEKRSNKPVAEAKEDHSEDTVAENTIMERGETVRDTIEDTENLQRGIRLVQQQLELYIELMKKLSWEVDLELLLQFVLKDI